MYKLRISKWGMKKNFKRDEHEQVALRLRHFAAAGLELPETFIDGKVVPIRRVKRHFGKKLNPRLSKQHNRDRPSQTFNSDGLLHTDFSRQWQAPGIVRITLQQSSYTHKFERLLIQVNNYYGPGVCMRSNDSNMARSSNAAGSRCASQQITEFMSTITDMANASVDGFAGALKTMWNRWYLSTPYFFRKFQRSTTLLLRLVEFCAGIRSRPWLFQFESLLFQHLALLIRRAMGDEHPLSMIVDLTITETGGARSNFHVLMRLLVDMTRQRGVHSEVFWLFQETYCDVLREEADPLTVTESYQSTLVRCKESFGEMSLRYNNLRWGLGVHFYRNDLDNEAEEIMLDVLRSQIDSDNLNEEFYTDIMEFLGVVCEAKGDFKAAERWYRKALPFAQRFYGNDGSTTVLLATRVENMNLVGVETNSSARQTKNDQIEDSVVERMMHDLSQLEISEQRDGFGAEDRPRHEDVSTDDTLTREQTTSQLDNSEARTNVAQFETVDDQELNLGSPDLQNGTSVDVDSREQNSKPITSDEQNTSYSKLQIPSITQDLSYTDTLPEVPLHWDSDLANLSDINFDLDLDCFQYQHGVTLSQDGAMDIDMDDWITYPHEESMERLEATMDDFWSWPVSEGQTSPVC